MTVTNHLPGMYPKRPKRNVIVTLVYLLLLALSFGIIR